MYYEKYEKKKRGADRPSFGEWLIQFVLRLIALAIAVGLAAGLVLYALPPALFAVEPDGMQLSLTDGLPTSCMNILLIGTDVEKEGAQRSDAMLIASVGYGRFRLTSLLRDTEVNIDGHGTGKLNAAYAYGGPELLMRTVNQTYGLNLMHYAQVDFTALAAVVDAIGGITLPEITQEEMEQINRNTRKSGKVFGPLGYVPQELTHYGNDIHLDGLQALSFARIRKIGDDYARTGRQRQVINAIVDRIRGNIWNPILLVNLSRAVMGSVNTNMSALEILSLGEKALLAGKADTMQLPPRGLFTEKGSRLVIDNRTACRDAFVNFVYYDR